VVEATEVTVTWLLLGANGQLGRSLQDVLSASKIEFVAAGRADADITDIASIENRVKSTIPSVIVNMAAWTDVDGAESHRDEAFLANATGAENVAKIAAKYQIPLVHISTDYVFDGTQTTPYKTDHTQVVHGLCGLHGCIANTEKTLPEQLRARAWPGTICQWSMTRSDNQRVHWH